MDKQSGKQNGKYSTLRFSPRYVINDEYRFIYFVIPKAACSSVKVALAPLFGIDVSGVSESSQGETEDIHTRYQREGYEITKTQLMRRFEGSYYSDYFKFAIVRNPFDRLRSCWREKLSRPNSPGFLRMDYEAVEGPPVRFWHGMPFLEFVEAAYRIPEEDANLHFASQHEVLCKSSARYLWDQEMMPDFVGRFENLREDFAHIAEGVGLEDYELPHMLKTSSSSRYRDDYDERAARQAIRRYARDVALLDYAF